MVVLTSALSFHTSISWTFGLFPKPQLEQRLLEINRKDLSSELLVAEVVCVCTRLVASFDNAKSWQA
eukprot:3931288-Amphidinium_carterae.1